MIRLKKDVGVYVKEEQVDMEDSPDEEDMDDVNLDDDRESHWRMMFEDNGGGGGRCKGVATF